MDQAEYRDAVAEITKLAEEYFFHTSLRRIAPRKSDEKLIEFWSMPDPDEGISMMEICEELRSGFLDGLTGIINPKFLGYILTRPVPEAHAFDLLANATHASPGVAHLTASGILIERCVLRWLATRMGIPTFSGMFTTGGCESTLIALKCARDQCVSRVNGITTPIVIYTSHSSHYSCKRAWDILGGGEGGVREFDVSSLAELPRQIQRDRESGVLPVAIMGTLGTTNTGEIEPLQRLSEIATAEGLWLHIDGAYGGGVLMLEEFAWLHDAVNRADSFSFDPHKWLGMPMGTGTVFLNDKHSFLKSFSFSAVFTDHQTFTSVIPDQCQMSIQGTRQLPGLRVWGAIRLLGFAEIKRRIRRTITLAKFLVSLLESNPIFKILSREELSVVVFTVKGFDQEAILSLLQQLAVNDEAFLTLTKVDDVWGIRATIISADTTEKDLEYIVERIVSRVSNRQ